MAKTSDLINYYAKLLIIQYATKARAVANVKAMVTPVIMDQLPVLVQEGFNLEDAVGVQLDVLGKYIGASRDNYGTTGPIVLSDGDFRTLLKMVLIKNTAGSSLATIQDLLAKNFPNKVRISDSTNMSISYVLSEELGSSDLLDVLIYGDFLPRPMAVNISVTTVPSFDITYFGFSDYSGPVSGIAPFNTYAFYQLTFPWLTY